MKKGMALVLTMSVMASLFAGCSTGGSTPGGEAPKSAGNAGTSANDLKGTVTVAAWNAAADALEQSIPGFKQKYPNVNVTINRVTSKYDKIIPPLTAGTGAPDIIQVQQRDFQNFMLKFPKSFVDLSSTIKAEDFSEAAWVSVIKDNKPYAIPWDLGPTAVWYRKDYYEKAGIDPKSLTTWDKFIESGKKLQETVGGKTKMLAFDLTGTDTNPDVYMMLLNELGGQFYNDKGDLKLNNPQSVRALEMVKRFKDENIVANGPTWDDRLRIVANGETASVIYPVWYGGSISTQAADQKGKWGVMPLPAFEEGGPNQANLGGSVLAITDQSKNKEAAKAFLEYVLLTYEGQDVQLKYGLFPSWKPYYNSAGFKVSDAYFGFPLAEFFGTVSTKIPPLQYGPYFLDLRKPLLDAYAEVLSGKSPIPDALKKAEEQSAKITGLKVGQ